MTKSTVWSVVGGIIAIVIAWWVVTALLSVLWLAVKVVLVAAVALAVYVGIRSLTSRERD